MKLVTRKAWGAKPPRARTANQPEKVDALVFHYSAAESDRQKAHSGCAARVRGIQAFHMGPARGWNDIGYSFLFCEHGYVFEGRGWLSVPAATEGHNSHTVAACFLGHDKEGRDDLTAGGRQAMVDIAHTALTQFKHRPFSFAGHRDYNRTACPGDEIYGFVHSKQFRALASRVNTPVLEPVVRPAWFLDWSTWALTGRLGPRPPKIPARIPEWALAWERRIRERR